MKLIPFEPIEEEYERRLKLQRRTLRVPLAIVLAAAYLVLYIGARAVMSYSYDTDPNRYEGQVRDPYLP